MSFTSLLFVFVFLPLALAVYHISVKPLREYVLLVLSLIFYSLGSPDCLLLFVISIAATVIIGRSMARAKSVPFRRGLLVLGIAGNVALLFYYKYFNFAVDTWSWIAGREAQLQEILLPLGISFYTFKAISYLADVYTGKAVLTGNAAHDLLYLSFFSQIQSGPITRYNACVPAEDHKLDLFADGAIRFMIGFNKKVLIANILANITKEIFGASLDEFSTAYAWLGAVCYSLELFFDFAGYSDMAIGVTEMFGFTCMENFNYPYMTESVSRFWRRWHISLSEWFRDYIYIPLGGSRNKSKARVYFNLFVVWILTGIWHGAAWNFVFWGLGYFVLIAFEKLTGLPDRFKTKFGKVLYRIFSLLFINFQWVMFRAESIRHGLGFIRNMIVYRSMEPANARTLFLLEDYAFFIILAIVLCFPVVPWIRKKLEGKAVAFRAFEVAEYLVILLAFIWSVSFVVAGQNNPFAYANF